MGLEDIKERLSAINNIIYFDRNDYLREKTSNPMKLKKFIVEVENILNNSVNEDDKYFLYGTLGNLYRIYGNPQKAINFLTLSLNHAKKIESIRKEIVSLIRYGEALKYNNKHQQALNVFGQALDKCKVNHEVAYIDFVLQHKGKCLMEMGRLKESEYCLNEALRLRKLKDDFHLIDSTLQGIELLEKLKREKILIPLSENIERKLNMSKYKIILFDLDGTLSDPKIGITKSVQYALQKLDIDEPNIDKLECFIGPPLHVSFAEYYGFDERNIQKAINYYRERFKEKGMFENELYSEIPLLLKSLQDQQYHLVVATSKPTVFSEQILEYFNIDQYFELVVGSNLDGTRSSKTEIIQYILNHYNEYKLDDFIMIGDRKYDIIGANNTGIDSIGVTYGYGSYKELSDSNPTFIVNRIDEIKGILIENKIG